MGRIIIVLILAAMFAAALLVVPRWRHRRRKPETKPTPKHARKLTPTPTPTPTPTLKDDLMWQYIIALVSTLVGVYVALFLNRIDVQKAEIRAAAERDAADRRLAAGLLRKAETELFELKYDVRTWYWMDQRRMRGLAPMEPPRVVETVLASDVVLRLASEDGLGSILSTRSRVAAVVHALNTMRGDSASIRSNLDMLGMTLGVLHHWVAAERRYILGEWTDGERNAYGNRWTMYEAAGDTTNAGTWAGFRSVPVAVRPNVMPTSIGRVRSVDLLFDSLPAPHNEGSSRGH